MKLVVGGYAQGKLKYVLEKNHLDDYAVWDGTLPSEAETQGKTIVIDHFHNWVKGCIRKGGNPEDEMIAFVETHPGCIIISDEIGNGIVPVNGFEREYRERTGRILVELAGRAEEVIRVICVIVNKIK